MPILIVLLSIRSHGQSSSKVTLDILTNEGHPIEVGASGYNVRIADKIWNYTHPDFIQAVDTLKPGWLRYFSGTMGDAFNSATGLYDYDYAWMMDHQKQYLKGYKFTKVKGPHRVYDLYQILGRVNGKLVITINGFTESPEVAQEMARFCKNHHIIVEGYQFCNEPYFYVPHRNRYWWNDGYDYARKMKPYADAIRKIDPEAKLALNYTWDGIWGFMKEIHKYQEKEGRYWNVFSKHSYAPHIGGKESFESAYRRANTRLVQVTSEAAMDQIENYTWEGAPLLITEFGVWNRAVSGIYSGVYVAEYTLRQLAHPNAWFIGSHEISSNAQPANPHIRTVLKAFKENQDIETDSIPTGVILNNEGKAMRLIHQVTSESNYIWPVKIEHGVKVPGLKDRLEEGLYAMAFRGTKDKDWLVMTNRSAQAPKIELNLNGALLSKELKGQLISSEDARDQNFEIQPISFQDPHIILPPFSVMILSWEHGRQIQPIPSRIFKAEVSGKNQVFLKWWKGPKGCQYQVRYGENPDHLDQVKWMDHSEKNQTHIEGLEAGKCYTFQVGVQIRHLHSEMSLPVTLKLEVPEQPEFFQTATREQTATLMWRSVADATGYRVRVKNVRSGDIRYYDAKATFGYRVEELDWEAPYECAVAAYNGLGESTFSTPSRLIPHSDLPILPRNITAFENVDGQVELHWIVQDSIHPNVKYKILRGSTLHQWDTIAKEIEGDMYIDSEVELWEGPVFYTILAYNKAGESSFHPNIATVIRRDQKVDIQVKSIDKTPEGLTIRAYFENIPLDGDIDYGIAMSDISYLTVEEQQYGGNKSLEGKSKGYFVVKIPKKELKEGHQYAFKAYVETNGKTIYSHAPHQQLKF